MMWGASTFQEVIRKISEPETKSHQYAYEKDLKRRIFLERANKLELKQDFDKEKIEQEAREYLARYAVAIATQSKEKGKGVLQGPSSPSLCKMEDTLEKGVELNINFEKLRLELYLFENEKRENIQQGLILLLVLNLTIRG